jgi:hypothetical protein
MDSMTNTGLLPKSFYTFLMKIAILNVIHFMVIMYNANVPHLIVDVKGERSEFILTLDIRSSSILLFPGLACQTGCPPERTGFRPEPRFINTSTYA